MTYDVALGAAQGTAPDGVTSDRVALADATGGTPRAAGPVPPAVRLGAVCRALHAATEPPAGRGWRVALDGATPGAGDGVATDRVPGLLAELRGGVTAYVCGLRAEGVRPERMVIGVKALVREAMAVAGWHDLEAAQVLTAHGVRWGIAAYYDR